MNFIDTIKQQIPLDKIKVLFEKSFERLGKITKKTYPGIKDAEKILKRIHFLLAENGAMDLGKQEIFTRRVKRDDGTTQSYTYTVDFKDKQQVKRMKNFHRELIDLTVEDSTNTKKESISAYLDYIAMTNA